MIRVSALYPNESGAKFDHGYFMDKHIPMMTKLLGPRGLVRIEVDKGISAADPNAPAPFIVVAHFIFNSVEEVHQGFKAAGREIMGDIPNYTSVTPTFQISEMVG